MYSQIRKEILEKIKPTPEEKKRAETIVKSQKERLEKLLKTDVVTGGSMAKGTWLKNNHDIDFFVVSPKPESITAKKLPFAQEVKGSRNYFQYEIDGFQIEVVPVKKIHSSKEIENVTDASPLHVKYTAEKLTSQDDVRLAKQFCKAHRVYGAESYINGFSGHVLELVIIYYGSFLSFIKAAAHWQEPVIIDIEEKKTYSSINKSKLRSPLVIIDPVQPERNAAAALSKKSFDTFIKAAQKFLKKPSASAFTKKPFRIPKAALCIEFEALDGKRDTAGTKCLKAFEFVLGNLEEFDIVQSGFEYNHTTKKARAYFVPKAKIIAKDFLHEGPPSKHKGATHFKKKHNDYFEKNNRLYTIKEREFTSAEKKTRFLLKQENVQRRVQKARLCQ